MYGAILGDIIGSPYEFDHNNIKTKDFPLFNAHSNFTDDTVMTLAIGKGIMETKDYKNETELKNTLVFNLKKLGLKYPNAGYGYMFSQWLASKNSQPYNSFGNGSAMRVSSIAWLFTDLNEVRYIARISAEITHNHPEGIKGAEATATAILMARNGHSKAEIKNYIQSEFGYNLNRTCKEIRPKYHHVESCQETVPEAITAFLEGNSFIDVIRTAVSLGGDSDTLTAIAGSIAEAFYGIPQELKTKCQNYLTPDLKEILNEFEQRKKEI